MRILLAATSNDVFSGASKCLIELAIKLKEKGNHVEISIPKKGGELETVLTKHGIQTVIIRERQCWYKYVDSNVNYVEIVAKRLINEVSILKCRKHLRSQKFDIVHINASTAYIVGKAAIEEGIPVVWHLREFMEEDLGISFVNRERSFKVLNKASCFIAISEQIRNKWIEQIKVPINVIYDGVPIDTYYVEKKDKHNKVNVLLYGRIVKGKGQLQYVQAAVKVFQKCMVPCSFYFAGKIEDQIYFNQCMEIIRNSSCEDKIRYIGEISDIKGLLAKTDIVCVCSSKEGFGRVTIESMLGKCLVVGAASGATTELVENGKTGVLYKSNNVDDLADKLTECIGKFDKYRNIVDNGQRYAIETFTDEKNVNNILMTYKKYVGNEKDSIV